MNIESHIVSLELAKKLKELGVEQESLWKWCIHSNGVVGCYAGLTQKIQSLSKVKEDYSAFTVTELMERLPATVDLIAGRYRLTIRKYDQLLDVSYMGTAGDALKTTMNRKLVDALAEMLIWLIEDEYVKVDK